MIRVWCRLLKAALISSPARKAADPTVSNVCPYCHRYCLSNMWVSALFSSPQFLFLWRAEEFFSNVEGKKCIAKDCLYKGTVNGVYGHERREHGLHGGRLERRKLQKLKKTPVWAFGTFGYKAFAGRGIEIDGPELYRQNSIPLDIKMTILD